MGHRAVVDGFEKGKNIFLQPGFEACIIQPVASSLLLQ